MLVIKRSVGESVIITHKRTGEKIEVMMTAVQCGDHRRASLGVTASDEWNIARDELLGVRREVGGEV